MSISIKELQKAILSLEKAVSLYNESKSIPEKKAFRDASIQRFEFTIELCWKVSMKILGSTTAAAKMAIREMARNNLINNPVDWINFIEGRNETLHSYDEDVAKKVYIMILNFLPHANDLFNKLNSLPK